METGQNIISNRVILIKQLKKAKLINVAPLQHSVNFHVWNIADWPDMQNDLAHNFNCGKGLSVVKTCSDGIESFGFSAAANNHHIINNFYLNNLEWLSNFCESFKDQASAIIHQHEQNKIILPAFVDKSAFVSTQNNSIKNTLMSKRQLTCAILLLEGYKHDK